MAGAAEVKVEQVFNLLVPISQSPRLLLGVSPSSSTTTSKAKTEQAGEWGQKNGFKPQAFSTTEMGTPQRKPFLTETYGIVPD